MIRRLFTLAAAMSLWLWIGWFILNLGIVRRNEFDADHSWYYWGIVPIRQRFLWLVRYGILIWCALGVLPACSLIVIEYRRWISRRFRPLGFCVKCRYDLTGNTSGACPECGTAVAEKGEAGA